MVPLAVPLIAMGVQAVGALIGQLIASGDKDKAEEIRAQAAALYGDDKINAIIKESQLGPSAWEGYRADAAGSAAQKLALQKLQEQATTQGLTEDERYGMAQGLDEAANYEKGQRGAIIDNANARGVGGSGLELAAQLQAQQGGAMRANASARSAQAEAARRKALAAMQLGEFGSGMRRQGFEEFGAKASAQDHIDEFNSKNTKDLRQWGVNGQADAMTGQAKSRDDAAAESARNWAAAGQMGGEAIGSYADYENKKKYGYGKG